MAENTDDTRGPGQLPPLEAFYLAIAAAATNLDQLELSQSNEDRRIAAEDAVTCWLAAQVALWQLESRNFGSPENIALARFVLGFTFSAIRDQLYRLMESVDDSALRRLLDQLTAAASRKYIH